MKRVRLTALLGLAVMATAFQASAYEVNLWPAPVLERSPGGETVSWSAIGPFLFSGPTAGPEAGHEEGFRPFYVVFSGNDSVKTEFLFPLFYLRKYPGNYKWSILELINREGIDASVTEAGGATDKHFDVWPFYFSHVTKDPIDTYHALLPVYGTIKYRLGYDRIFWAPFPVFVQTTRRAVDTTYVPWPFIRFVHGAAKGFAVWPLFGNTKGPGVARNSFYLWPLIWDNTLEPDVNAPEGSRPGTEFGVLPFYMRTTAPGYVSTNYAWPFFGTTERTLPTRYSETRYFWPFAVQGRGDDKYVNRWGPFYTHSINRGTDSKWVGWPFWHQTRFADDDIAETKTQFFYFVYWSLDERSLSRPLLAHAYKRHVWPLVSMWDNGAGSRQVEFPSLFEVFFPDNPDMRTVWTPIFTFYRYDHRPTGETRQSLFWNAVTWRRDASGGLDEFHVGPLLGVRRANGVRRWTILGFDFAPKPGDTRTPSR